MPWPYSTLQIRIVPSPSRLKSSHRASTGLAARSPGSGETPDGTAGPTENGRGEPDGGASTGPSPAGVLPAGTSAGGWLVGTGLAGGCGTTVCSSDVRPAA